VDDYATAILASKPDSIKDDDFVNKLYKQIKADPNPRETYKVLHMSDIRMDFDYTPGSLWMCGSDGMCCRPENGYPEDPELQAGNWGSYECDLPEKTLQSFLNHVRDEVKPDFVVWTGDNSPHDTWKNTAD